MKVEKEIVICDITSCLNCGNCIIACKRRHHDVSRHTRAASTVIGISLFPNLCMVCDDPKCIEVCNHKGVEKDENGHIVVTDNCIGCGLCMRACPYNAILLFSGQEEKKSFFERLITFINPEKKGKAIRDQGRNEKEIIDLKWVEEIIEDYREGPGSLINLLFTVQDKYGYLPQEVLIHISNKLSLSLLRTYHLVTFYKAFKIRNGQQVLKRPEEPLGVAENEDMENGEALGLEGKDFKLWVNQDKCISCGLCVRVCKEIVGACAMRFSKQGLYGEIHKAFVEFPEYCTGCGECAKVCPTKAITFESEKAKKKQRVIVKCDGCAGYDNRACVINCPTGALRTVHIEEYFSKHKESFNIELRDLIRRSLEKEMEEEPEEEREKNEKEKPEGKREEKEVFVST